MSRSQELSVVARLFPLILDGSKTSTIRWNENPVSPGPMRYVSDESPYNSVEVLVTACTTMLLSDAAKFLGRENEWPPQVMLAGMQDHYPDIALTDEVVVIEHLTPQETKALTDMP